MQLQPLTTLELHCIDRIDGNDEPIDIVPIQQSDEELSDEDEIIF